MTTMPEQAEKVRASRLRMGLIFILFLVPVIAASYMYQLVSGGHAWKTSNKGNLIMPAVPLRVFASLLVDGKTLTLKEMQGHWTLVYFTAAPCGEACKQDIYHLRQLHAALGKEMHRVQRLLVLTNQQQYSELTEFLAAYPQSIMLEDATAAQSFSKQFVDRLLSGSDRIFLIDPLGNLMMSYPDGVPPKFILEDLRKLLKVSQVG